VVREGGTVPEWARCFRKKKKKGGAEGEGAAVKGYSGGRGGGEKKGGKRGTEGGGSLFAGRDGEGVQCPNPSMSLGGRIQRGIKRKGKSGFKKRVLHWGRSEGIFGGTLPAPPNARLLEKVGRGIVSGGGRVNWPGKKGCFSNA